MPSCTKSTASSPTPPAGPWTPTMAQAALELVAFDLQQAVELLEGIHRGLPPPADLADRQEHRKPYDVATEVLGAIECASADLRGTIFSLQKSAQATDESLRAEFEEERQRWPQ
jgi:hypothetical protein